MAQKKITLTFTPYENSEEVDIAVDSEGFDGDVNEVARHIFLTASSLGNLIEEQEKQELAEGETAQS